MSHTRKHVISSFILPMFSDPEVREHISVRQCQRIDAMSSQEEFSDRDVRCLVRAIETALDD
jgi:hypothetical protein